MHRTTLLSRLALSAPAMAVALAACPTVRSPELLPSNQPPVQREESILPLKVHLITGDLLLLDRWQEWPGDSGVIGSGTRYDTRRHPIGTFEGKLPGDSIALLEVTRTTTATPAGSVVLGTYTVLMGAVTAVCLADPKSCFGSCPTFYLNDSDDRPVAEGFSASVARVLEATDVDDLGHISASGRRFTLTMRNEALETHAVRSVRLLVARRPARGTLVRGAAGGYFTATDSAAPASCIGGGEDCVAAVRARDGYEWATRADSTDLGARDSVDLMFPASTGPRALLVTSRQSFITTYVFYQSLAWAGSRAGDLLADLERRGTSALPGAWTILRRLTEVEVFAAPAGEPLRPAGVFGEAGPIAADQHALPLPGIPAEVPLHVRLRFARGGWRFDRVATVSIAPAPDPVALLPLLVERAGAEDTVARQRLLDPGRHLITQPGDAYRLTFALPHDARQLTFFLESRGYYYEWMRPEWLAEENPALLGLIAMAPDQALQRMAPDYARIEPRLEALFWASRFGRR